MLYAAPAMKYDVEICWRKDQKLLTKRITNIVREESLKNGLNLRTGDAITTTIRDGFISIAS